ncbi:MAG TPA: radical SAM protein [Dehalococcoidales bacterium]|nr:radical SAM protein [Dehalococcoidales bacterium]
MKHSITWDEQQKARRRLEKETGARTKDWGGKLPFAFVYPNSYFIGMSNLGLQAVYGYLNQRPDCLCERVFWEKENSLNRTTPLSVESQRPLTDFAVLAFSLNYEIDFFNLAPILESSNIPLYSEERDETMPLIIAGGPCVTANPLPVSPFFDCLCIGEAEAILPHILSRLADGLGGKREGLLQELAQIEGVWVPRYPQPRQVVRQYVKNLNEHPVHSIVLTRETELGDLFLVETGRGCAHACRFCLVSSAFSPMRFHQLDSILRQAEDGLKLRARIGLVGPAVTDHPQIEELLDQLLNQKAQISISSLRISSLNGSLLKKMVKGGLRSVALAPEAGSPCLRGVIKKGLSEEQILAAVRLAAEAGMQQIKLYFMVGLPQETDSDIQSIVDLTLKGKALIEKAGSQARLTLNISPFIPKAGTVFQWLPMAGLKDIQSRISLIKNQLTSRGVKINSESPLWSEVQSVLSRGDNRLAAVLADMRKEALPDWRDAIAKHRLDLDYFAHQRWDTAQKLPWHFIDSGVPVTKIKAELNQALGDSQACDDGK